MTYDVLVKCEQYEFQDENFYTFWESHKKRVVPPQYASGDMRIENMTLYTPDHYIFKYNGYLRIKGTVGIYSNGQVLIDGKNYLSYETGQFEFEGYVSESISIGTSWSQAEFTEFSTVPDIYSEDVNIAYCTDSLYNNEVYGELNINEVYQQGYFHWYNPDDDIETQCMKIISSSSPIISRNPFIGLDAGGISEVDSIEIDTAVKKSGLYNLKYNPVSNQGILTSLPILIHKDDVGIKNTIGPFIKEDGSKVTIKLTII